MPNISRSYSGEYTSLRNWGRWFDSITRYQNLLSESKHGVGASLLTKNELGSIPSRTAKQLGEVVGYGMGLHPV